jgi:hypothetical protein
MPNENTNQDPMMQPKVTEPEVMPTPSPRVEPVGTTPEIPPVHSDR